jgi:hypothetical protein
VLAEPGVTKVAAMRALFERIGVPSMKSARDFETLEAIRIGLAVEQEYVEAMSRQHQDAGSRRPRSKGSSLACN